MQAILDQYGTGVEITQVQLQKVDPPAAVIESFRDVQRANTDAERDAQRGREPTATTSSPAPAATPPASSPRPRAPGRPRSPRRPARPSASCRCLTAYQAAKDVTLQRLYIETMQDILTHTPSMVVDDQLQGVVPFLPLNDLGRTAARRACRAGARQSRRAGNAAPSQPRAPAMSRCDRGPGRRLRARRAGRLVAVHRASRPSRC